MRKTTTFSESDDTLIRQIPKCQTAHGLSSFAAAVRKLCKDALAIEKIRH